MQARKIGLYACFGIVMLGLAHKADEQRKLRFMERAEEQRQLADARNFAARQIQCLALNAYYEARSDNRRSMIAVSNVVMNRAEILDTDPCEVVYERNHRGCQFSWTCNPQRAKRWEEDSFRRAMAVAYEVYHGKVDDITRGATHYHTTAIRPFWSRSKQFVKVDRIGSHVYYRSMENRWRTL